MHCAAERRPDVVEGQPDAASQLNVAASANLAKEAGKETSSRGFVSGQNPASIYTGTSVHIAQVLISILHQCAADLFSIRVLHSV